MKRYCYFIFVSTVIIIFLLNSKQTMEGSVAGLILWLNTVVPTLLPFMILSSILINLNAEKLLHKIIGPFTGKIFGLSPSGNYVFFIGLFCGYPLGAKTAADLLREKRISRGEAQYLMNFCNNISPIFTIGFICNTLLNNTKIIPVSLFLLYGIPLILGLFTKKHYIGNREKATPFTPPDKYVKTDPIKILDNAIVNAAMTALKLGGYIILFSVFCSLLEHTRVLPESIRAFSVIILEITNGCSACVKTPFLIANKTALPALFACATFGGLAGIAQTSGMIQDTTLSLKQYIIFRIICSATVFIISCLIF